MRGKSSTRLPEFRRRRCALPCRRQRMAHRSAIRSAGSVYPSSLSRASPRPFLNVPGTWPAPRCQENEGNAVPASSRHVLPTEGHSRGDRITLRQLNTISVRGRVDVDRESDGRRESNRQSTYDAHYVFSVLLRRPRRIVSSCRAKPNERHHACAIGVVSKTRQSECRGCVCHVTMPTSSTRRSRGSAFVGGDSMEATSILEALAVDGQPRIERARSLADGLTRLLEPESPILLMLTLPDSRGIDTLTESAAQPDPILVLCGVEDESRAGSRCGGATISCWRIISIGTVDSRGRGVGRQAAADPCGSTTQSSPDSHSIDRTPLHGRFRYVTHLNTVAEAMTGWWRADAAGRPLQDVLNIINGSTGERSPNPADLAVRQNKTVALTENCILVRRDGSQCAIEDSAAPIHDRAGRITGAVIVFHDVSSRGRCAAVVASGAARLSHRPESDPGPRSPAAGRLFARRYAARRGVVRGPIDRQRNDPGHDVMINCSRRCPFALRPVTGIGYGRPPSGDEFAVVLSDLENWPAPASQAPKSSPGSQRRIGSASTTCISAASVSASILTMPQTPRCCSGTRIRRCITPRRMAGTTCSASALRWPAARSTVTNSRCGLSRRSTSRRGPMTPPR